MNIGKIAGIVNISIVKILKKYESIDKVCIVKLSEIQKYRKKGYRKKMLKPASIAKKMRSKYRKKKNQWVPGTQPIKRQLVSLINAN